MTQIVRRLFPTTTTTTYSVPCARASGELSKGSSSPMARRRHSAPAGSSRLSRALARVSSLPHMRRKSWSSEGPTHPDYTYTTIAAATSCHAYLTQSDDWECPDQTLKSQALAQPPLIHFIAYVLRASGLEDPRAVEATLETIRCFRQTLPESLEGLTVSGHLLFLSAIMLIAPSYQTDPERSSNDFWSSVSGYPVQDIPRFKAQMHWKLVEFGRR